MDVQLKLDRNRSNQLALQVHPQRNQCYDNAMKVMFYLGSEELSYVEGVAVILSIGVPLEHGWVQDEHGNIIDVTWCDTDEPIAYFPLVEIPQGYFRMELRRAEYRLPMMTFAQKTTAEAVLKAMQTASEWVSAMSATSG